mmetsp:Transcript_19545/g.40805  ORF Transcript_19545/g.40805 Transcript_19545/m.40805 type:complete len:256 (+) Transcript_19545:148-915(+)
MSSNVLKKRLLILGGNGYVGQNICHAALLQSDKYLVRSLSRSGPPSPSSTPPHLASTLEQVEWVSGDVFDASARKDSMEGVDYVVSTIGAFGSNEFMQRICGDATIEAILTAKEAGVKKFGFVSSAQVYEGSAGVKIPESVPMHGYFQGKYRAEKELVRGFPNNHVILRPGFIYGPRAAGALGILPLHLLGAPLSFVGTGMGPVSKVIGRIPFVGKEMESMVPVDSVGRAMVESLGKEGEMDRGITLEAEDIRRF